ncbi:MAG: DMT family transporter [Pseudomonadota bacterium]
MNTQANIIVRIAPVVFVFLWATGFVGAKYGTRDAEPLTFLAIRFAITFIILAPIVFAFFRPPRDAVPQILHSFFVGCLIQTVYLGCVFFAIDQGLAAGVSSLIVALQPFFTAIFAWFFLSERLSWFKLVCFLIALGGVLMVLFPDLNFVNTMSGITVVTLTASIVATIGISLGAVYQKRCVTSLNLWVSTASQFAGATVLTTLAALVFETGHIAWTSYTILSLAWLVLVLSIGAVALLMYLIRRGDAASVASLFFLVPVVAMGMSWVLFDERLTLVQVLGSALVVASVAFASRK